MNAHRILLGEAAPSIAECLPVDAFWHDLVPLPDGLSRNEIRETAAVAIEAHSPYPEDRLYKGHLALPGTGQLLVYAASQPRLAAIEQEPDPAARWSIPAFLPAILVVAASDEDLLLDAIDAEGFAVVRASGKLRLCTTPTGWDPEVRRELARIEGIPERSLPEQGETLSLESNDASVLAVRSTHLGETTIEIKDSDLQDADVRGLDAVAALRRTERNQRRLDGAFKGMAAALAVFLMLQLLLIPLGNNTARREAYLADLEQEVAAMDTRRELVLRLEALATGSPKPLAILDFANQLRPDSIEWFEALVTADGNATIEGKAPDIRSVNTYAERLRQSGRFTSVVNEATTRQGQTAFTLELSFANSFSLPPVEATISEEGPVPDPPSAQKATASPALTASNNRP